MRRRLLLAVALAVSCGVACRGDADFSDAMPEPVILVAEQYQTEILELDRLVFDPAPMTDARRATLEGRFQALAKRVKEAGDSKFLTLESLELRRLAAASERLEAGQIQHEWMRIRNNLFDDRAWFARSAADLDAIVPPPPLSPSPPPASPTIARESTEPVPTLPPTPAGPFSEAPADDELEGRWAVLEITSDGQPNPDRELTGAILTIQGNRLTFESPARASQGFTFQRVRDGLGVVLRVESDNGKEKGWMIYEIADGVLKLAFYDGLGERPTGFVASPGNRGPELNVIRLVRTR